MNPREAGFLLLSSQLGNPDRRPLSTAQLRTLADRAVGHAAAEDRDLQISDLLALGYGQDMAARIVGLLEEEALLSCYLQGGEKLGCEAVTRVSEDYPLILRKRLGLDSPGCLWVKGDVSLLKQPAVALVGSRDLSERNAAFAAEVGRQAALQGYVLVSGNARGADRTAQEACLDAGGQVISVVADELYRHPLRDNVLYVCEDGFAEEFSSQRALSRNRLIHALAEKTFVAQCSLGKGGTWSGCSQNLRYNWSPVFCFDDGSEGTRELLQRGASPVKLQDLQDIDQLKSDTIGLF